MTALGTILRSWRGTPHVEGWCVPAVGVDCWRFVDAVFAEWGGHPRARPVNLRACAVHHRPALAFRWARALARAHGPLDEVPTCCRLPGTVLLEHPGHGLLVDERGLLWDVADRVRCSGQDPGSVITAAWRPRWADAAEVLP